MTSGWIDGWKLQEDESHHARGKIGIAVWFILYLIKNVFFNYILLSSLIPATGGVFGPQGESGSEPEDDGQMKFYTEQHRGRRRSKGTSSRLLQGDWFVLSCTSSSDHFAPPAPALIWSDVTRQQRQQCCRNSNPGVGTKKITKVKLI